ncbi:MAG TPA: fatty acid desaturase [Candidatus Methylomirabilis sp.]|nr:fatty acid desaturase [Candidatus Methylomirabilis sp.]
MSSVQVADKPESNKVSWRHAVAKYEHPDLRRSVWQVVNTLTPYFVLWYVMYRSLEVSYWITLALSALTAGFLVRIFIIFHDCGHASFFKSQKANDTWGFIAGVLTMSPYFGWRREHAMHHATAGDLDRRGVGDIWTLTVKEYLELSPSRRLRYRLYRHPLVMFVIGPLFVFLIRHRFAERTASKRERHSVYWTNLAIGGIVALMHATIGIKAFVLVQLPIVMIASAVGVWLFYVQHQYEGVYWERHENWDYVTVALQGSSFYKLPKILQWFTGNIGFHHIHHLSPRIPNYYLERCHEENPMFQEVRSITLLDSVKSFAFRLWDEERRQLVGFGCIKDLQSKQAMTSHQ